MDFKLPDIGEGIHEGEVTKWLVKAGDSITADQPMVEVMTDKATVEIPSPVSGTVEALMAKEGETIQVGKTLLRIKESGKVTPTATEEAPPKAPAPTERPARVEREIPKQSAQPIQDDAIPFQVLATPATRKLARDLSVDLKSLKGTGLHGRVTKMDVQMAYEGHQAATPRTSHPSQSTQMIQAPVQKPSLSPIQHGQVSRVPLKGVRKRIAEAMSNSVHTAAHFTYVEEVDMTEIVKLRKSALEEAKSRDTKLTFLPFIIKAVIPALKDFPYFNSSLDDKSQEILLRGDYNIGIATDTPNGLIVPVVKNADQKNIWELADEIAALSDRARAGKSQLDDLRGGTFTLTNAGSLGGVFATPIINHPEVAILGVNAIRKRPVVKDDQIVVRDIMFLSLSVDHRVVDGADAARFMNRLVFYLSEPNRLVFA